jgi:hypothetical protein
MEEAWVREKAERIKRDLEAKKAKDGRYAFKAR